MKIVDSTSKFLPAPSLRVLFIRLAAIFWVKIISGGSPIYWLSYELKLIDLKHTFINTNFELKKTVPELSAINSTAILETLYLHCYSRSLLQPRLLLLSKLLTFCAIYCHCYKLNCYPFLLLLSITAKCINL